MLRLLLYEILLLANLYSTQAIYGDLTKSHECPDGVDTIGKIELDVYYSPIKPYIYFENGIRKGILHKLIKIQTFLLNHY